MRWSDLRRWKTAAAPAKADRARSVAHASRRGDAERDADDCRDGKQQPDTCSPKAAQKRQRRRVARGPFHSPDHGGTGRGHRCLVPASGWYEWQRLADGKRKPIFIRRADGKPLAFAGLWSIWRPPDVPLYGPGADPPIRSAVILTAAAAPAIAAVHDRMPLALPETRWDEWLTRKELPLSANWLEAAHEETAAKIAFTAPPVSSGVNSPCNDDPACVAPI